MHEEQTIAINDPVGWMSVSQSVCHMSEGPFWLIQQMVPLWCSHNYITVATGHTEKCNTWQSTRPQVNSLGFRLGLGSVLGLGLEQGLELGLGLGLGLKLKSLYETAPRV